MNFIVLILLPFVAGSLTPAEIIARRISRLAKNIEEMRGKIAKLDSEISLQYQLHTNLGCWHFRASGPVALNLNMEKVFSEITNPQILATWPLLPIHRKFVYCESIRAKSGINLKIRDELVNRLNRLTRVKSSYEWRIDAGSEDSLPEKILSLARDYEERELRFEKVESELQEFFNDQNRHEIGGKIFWQLSETPTIIHSLIYDSIYENDGVEKFRTCLEMLRASGEMNFLYIYSTAKFAIEEFRNRRVAAANELLAKEIEFHSF